MEKLYFSNATRRIMKKFEARKALKSACFKKSFDEAELQANSFNKYPAKPKAVREKWDKSMETPTTTDVHLNYTNLASFY